MEHLFVYGSLLFPELVTALTGKKFRSFPATLEGFRRCRIKNCDYPAIVETPGAKVDGQIIENVDDKSIQLISFFEGNEYAKLRITVTQQNKKLTVSAFVWIGEKTLLEDSNWDEFEFKRQSLALYLKEVVPETRAAFHSQNS